MSDSSWAVSLQSWKWSVADRGTKCLWFWRAKRPKQDLLIQSLDFRTWCSHQSGWISENSPFPESNQTKKQNHAGYSRASKRSSNGIAHASSASFTHRGGHTGQGAGPAEGKKSFRNCRTQSCTVWNVRHEWNGLKWCVAYCEPSEPSVDEASDTGITFRTPCKRLEDSLAKRSRSELYLPKRRKPYTY